MRKCPNCSVSLTKINLDGVDLDTCPQCAGIYFDTGELQKLKNKPNAWAEIEAKVMPRGDEIKMLEARPKLKTCPACSNPMMPYKFLYTSEIILDECDGCGGVWVDDNELDAMLTFVNTVQPADAQMKPEVLAALAQMDEAAVESRIRNTGFQGMMRMLSYRLPRL